MTQLCDESRKWLTTGFWRTANTADVREQFDGRADINAQDTAGERALYKAVSWNRDPEVVALLLNLDADIEAVEPQHGNRPLHKAVENGNLIFTSLLLSRGAEVNAKDNNGTTPIHMASRYASDEAGLEMVRLLLDRGANPRARDNSGATPLHRVYWPPGLLPVTVELLLDWGADPNARDIIGKTPSDWIRNTGADVDSQIVWILAELQYRPEGTPTR